MVSAFRFLTVLGSGRGRERSDPRPAAVTWFPLVGAATGLLVGLVWWGSAQVWTLPVAAAVVVAFDLGVTGLLHLDGLVDAADGLLPPMDRARRLEVMRDPGTGAFGVGAAAAVLLLRWSALAALHPHPLLVGGLWCASRTAMALTVGHGHYVRDSGLATGFRGGPRRTGLLAVGAAGAVALGAAWSVPAGAVAVVVALGAFGLVVLLAARRIGGYTGDVLGAAGLVAETVGLVTAAAAW